MSLRRPIHPLIEIAATSKVSMFNPLMNKTGDILLFFFLFILVYNKSQEKNKTNLIVAYTSCLLRITLIYN